MKINRKVSQSMRLLAIAATLSISGVALANGAHASGYAHVEDWVSYVGPDITGAGTGASYLLVKGWGPVTGPGYHASAGHTGSFGSASTSSSASSFGQSSVGIQVYSSDYWYPVTNTSATETEAFTLSFSAELYGASSVADTNLQGAGNYEYVAFQSGSTGFDKVASIGVPLNGSSAWSGSASKTFWLAPGQSDYIGIQSASGSRAFSNRGAVPAPAALTTFAIGAFVRRRRFQK